ncbi:hypothetical protein QDY65_09480 [Pyrococcus kukulkanii]|uniref:hypothetical protein n=1 Tax=Pyrococcus kukulkanii TaxID=1609559 RepID=UPI00356158CB
MRKAILGAMVTLLLVGAYASYVVSYPKYPKVEGCVNPFAVVKPVSRVQENWSKIHVFFKLATSRDFWKLAKPWNVDYSHVKVIKHTFEYKGKNITMLAMGIPLRDKKHVIALYEFSKPVQGVKRKAYLFEITNNKSEIKVEATVTNGYYSTNDECVHRCRSSEDCDFLERCETYCCSVNVRCAIECCATGGNGWCTIPCLAGPAVCLTCIVVACPLCVAVATCCDKEGSKCAPIVPGP